MLFRVLNQPYPLAEVTRKNIIGLVLAGVFVAVFLLIFQPFGIFQWQTDHKVIKVAGYGVVTVVVLLIDYFLIRRSWKAVFNEKDWKVWKELVWQLFILTSIAAANYFYNIFILNIAAFRIAALAFTILTTFSVGIFPSVAFILTNYIIRLRRYTRPASVHHSQHESAPVKQLVLIAENEKDRLLLTSDELLFIESSDNYCTVYMFQDNRVVKQLIRSSLTRLETQISHPEIVRSHRSYIVNLGKVERVSGNAQGYKLHLANYGEPVPVARKYTAIVSANLQKA